MFITQNKRDDQKGTVLVISLLMLLMLSLIGVSAMQNTNLEEKMAGNMRSHNLAFQAAETALRKGEGFLEQATLPAFTDEGTDGLYATDSSNIPSSREDWANFNTVNYSESLEDVDVAPQYIVHKLGVIAGGGNTSLDASVYSESEMYRVTARGTRSSAVVVVQSTYKR